MTSNSSLRLSSFTYFDTRLRNLELKSTANVGCVNLTVFCSGGVHSQCYQIGFLKVLSKDIQNANLVALRMNPVGTKNRQIHATYIGSTVAPNF